MLKIVIYALTDPVTSEVRYIGKTANALNDRLRTHCRDAERNERRHVCRWIRGLLITGSSPEIVELERCGDDWPEAERFWIQYWRFLGANLTNHAVGGEGGGAGIPKPPEWREMMSVLHRGRKRTPEQVAKHAAALRGRKLTPEHVEKVRAASIGRCHSDATKERQAEARRRRWEDDDYRTAALARLAATRSTDEWRQAMTENALRQWETRRDDMVAGMRRAWTPERRAAQAARIAERNRARAKRPDV